MFVMNLGILAETDLDLLDGQLELKLVDWINFQGEWPIVYLMDYFETWMLEHSTYAWFRI